MDHMSFLTSHMLHFVIICSIQAAWAHFMAFIRSPKLVKEAIMTDINDLVQECWRTSSDGAVEVFLLPMRRLFKILQECFIISKVCFDIISVFATAVDLADENMQRSADPNSWQWHYSTQWDLDDRIRAKFFKTLSDGYRRIFDQ